MTLNMPNPPHNFIVDTASERNNKWTDGSTCYVKDTNKYYILDNGEWVEISGGGSASYMYPVWAEENGALGASNTYEWAYGNGANTPSDGGVTIYVPSGWTCTVVAMSLRVGGGTATVELMHNGTPKGSACQVVLSSGQSATNEIATPLAIANNDYINFRTVSSASTSGPCVVTAWLRMEGS